MVPSITHMSSAIRKQTYQLTNASNKRSNKLFSAGSIRTFLFLHKSEYIFAVMFVGVVSAVAMVFRSDES